MLLFPILLLLLGFIHLVNVRIGRPTTEQILKYLARQANTVISDSALVEYFKIQDFVRSLR